MPRGKVLVTGASTGIGEATATHLRGLGFEVIAGVRKDSDAKRMRDAGLEPAVVDVTDAVSIARARDAIGDAPLAGLVNNAGIAISGPLEFVPVEELREQLEVNVVGQVAVIQALLPALRRGRGRIVNVSSIRGRVALPLAGPYAASKFALEAVSDSLRREVGPHGVDVIVVEPGGVKTPIWDKGVAKANEMRDAMPPEADELYPGDHGREPEDRDGEGTAADGRCGGDRQGDDGGAPAHALRRRSRREAARPRGPDPPGPRHGSPDRAGAGL